MAITVDTVALQFFGVANGVPIACGFSLYVKAEVFVYYCNAGLLAVQGTDYTVALSGDFNTFIITPTASLITKINAYIAAHPTDQNTITVRRTLDYLTAVTPPAVRDNNFTSREFERMTQKLQQLEELGARTIHLTANQVGAAPALAVVPPGKSLVVSGDGTQLVAGPDAADIAGAGPAATAAVAAAAAAVPAGAAATASAAAAAASAAAAQITQMIWRGLWVTATAYVQYNGVRVNASGSYICLVNHTSGGSFAADLAAGKWGIMTADGANGAGTGDMVKATYDPTSKNADAFAMVNMVEGATTKILTDVERTKLAGIATGANVTNATTVAASMGTSKTAPVDADAFAILDSAASFALKVVSGTAIKLWLKTYFDTIYKAIAAGVAWSAVTGTPNTLAGYGIIDGASAGLGQSQVYSSPARAVGTVYQNTSAKPILVCIQMQGLYTSEYHCRLRIGAANPPITDAILFSSPGPGTSSTNKQTASGSAVVPSGFYYRLVSTGDAGAGTIGLWTELS